MLRATIWAHVKGGEEELCVFDSMGDSGYDIGKTAVATNAI